MVAANGKVIVMIVTMHKIAVGRVCSLVYPNFVTSASMCSGWLMISMGTPVMSDLYVHTKRRLMYPNARER